MNRIYRGVSNLAKDIIRAFILAFIVISAFMSFFTIVSGGLR